VQLDKGRLSLHACQLLVAGEDTEPHACSYVMIFKNTTKMPLPDFSCDVEKV